MTQQSTLCLPCVELMCPTPPEFLGAMMETKRATGTSRPTRKVCIMCQLRASPRLLPLLACAGSQHRTAMHMPPHGTQDVCNTSALACNRRGGRSQQPRHRTRGREANS